MLRFSIYKPDSIVVVDNAPLVVSLAALASNIVVVAFQIDQGSVEFNDRPNLRTPFTDPSPYQSLLNSWITAAASASPPLQLAQAQQLKKDLVEAIFHHKRRLPYTYGAWQYDARDEALANMSMLTEGNATVSSDSSALVTAINTAFSTITGQINGTVVAGANAMVSANNGSAAAVNTWSYYNHFNWSAAYPTAIPSTIHQALATGGGMVGLGSYSGGFAPGTGTGYGGFANMTALANIAGASVTGVVGTGIVYTGNITHMPLNASAPQAIPAVDIFNAMLGIASRRNTLNSNRLTKQIAVGNLSTIAACAAYDATAGWSF